MQWLTSTAKLRSKIARWSLILAEYDMEIVHRAGKDNTVPDLLSRQPYGGTPAPEPGSAQLASAYLAAVPQLPVAGFSRLAGQWAMPLLLGWSQGFSAKAKRPRFDIWEDASAVQFVRQQLSHTAVTPSRWQQLTRLCAQYEARGEEIWRTVPGQMPRLVPQPSERSRIVHKVHESIGHLGRDRTYAMVAQRYYWPKMWSTVAAALQECTICDRVHASFSAKPDRLQSLPLMGLFYRFHVDSAVSLPTTEGGSRHVLIIVEAFSKWVDLVPVADLTAKTAATAFRERVLARFGRPVEVVTDNGSEFKAEFHQMLVAHGIDHRYTSPAHPEANGAAERLVQVLKQCLRKYVIENGVANWDLQLTVIEFGYRTTPQRLTGYSPYFLVYGRHPTHPEQVKVLLDGHSVDVEDEAAMMELITHRANVMAQHLPLAYERAVHARQRDKVRYQRVRQRDLPPRTHRYRVGDYVYVAHQPINTLDARAARTILRVREVKPYGVLVLEGSDGATAAVRMERCAPCHSPHLMTVDHVAAELPCEVCGSPSLAAPMLLCDGCDRGYHISCLQPPLEQVPPGDWYCPDCQPSASSALWSVSVPIESEQPLHRMLLGGNDSPSD